jgi:hypothetical protein
MTGSELPPNQRIMQMLTGHWISQLIHAAAVLGLADLVEAGPKNSQELAQATRTHAPSLFRLLRGLASIGVFAEDGQGRFGLTPLAECLLSDRPGSQRGAAIMTGSEHYRAWGELLWSVRTGKPAFDHVFGKPIFDYLAEHPESARIFDEGMTGVHGAETAAIAAAYDFSAFRTLVDVGGGNGSTLAGILPAFPSLSGVLFDLPHVVDRARQQLKQRGLEGRCSCVGGSFFESVAPGADACLLRHIIHDWDDDKSIVILRNCRKALPAKGKLLVVESVIPPGNDPDFGKLLDLAMLVIPGGKERTAAEFRGLYQAAGFQLTRIVPTKSPVSIIEGSPI